MMSKRCRRERIILSGDENRMRPIDSPHPYVFAPKLGITAGELGLLLTHLGLRIDETVYRKLPGVLTKHFVKE